MPLPTDHEDRRRALSLIAAERIAASGLDGVTIRGPVGVDMKAVKARKDAVAGASRRGVERSLKTLEGCTVYEGSIPNRLLVIDDTVSTQSLPLDVWDSDTPGGCMGCETPVRSTTWGKLKSLYR